MKVTEYRNKVDFIKKEKYCNGCESMQPFSNFHKKESNTTTGLASYCKPCANSKTRYRRDLINGKIKIVEKQKEQPKEEQPIVLISVPAGGLSKTQLKKYRKCYFEQF